MVDVIISTAFDELNDSRAEQGIVMRKKLRATPIATEE
jgi:hypothetical protein